MRLVILAAIGFLLCGFLGGCAMPDCWHADTNRDCSVIQYWNLA
jgi:hypothetical protein